MPAVRLLVGDERERRTAAPAMTFLAISLEDPNDLEIERWLGRGPADAEVADDKDDRGGQRSTRALADGHLHLLTFDRCQDADGARASSTCTTWDSTVVRT